VLIRSRTKTTAGKARSFAPTCRIAGMKWIKRERIKVDRVGCRWLIRNFVDPAAEFVFFPHDTDRVGIDFGTTFDVPNCELGHHREDVSFNSILKRYNLADPALLLLGQIIRASDSHLADLHPAGEGLRCITGRFGALGLTDYQICERDLTVYDAFYAECQRRLKSEPLE
jgi:hypothetical protein